MLIGKCLQVTLRSHSHCEKYRVIDMSVCKFGNWLRDRSLMIGDILYIVAKGISIALILYFLKTKKVDTRTQNTSFSVVHLSSQHNVTSPTLGPATAIKRKICNMSHTSSERPKESDVLVEKKKGGRFVRLVFAQNGVEKNHKISGAMLFTPPTFSRAFANVPWQRK